jgi:hypothetical protein
LTIVAIGFAILFFRSIRILKGIAIKTFSVQNTDLPRKKYPSKMRVERPKKEQLSHEPTQTRTNCSHPTPN